MNKKITIGSKPSNQKNADEWVTTRQITEPPQETTKRLTIDISAQLHAQIKIKCAQNGLKMADVIRELLQERFGSIS